MTSPPSSSITPTFGELRVVWPAGALLGEGLCWSPARQAIYWVDILGQTLMRQDMRTGERRTWSFDENISAVAERARHPGLIVSLRRAIAFFDPDTGALQRLPEAEPQWPGNRFNDGKCDAQGRFWAGTMDFACRAPTGSLYRVTAGPPLPHIECAWDARFPVTNGPAWSADGRTLWLNDTARGAVHALDCDLATGRVSRPRRWLQLAAGQGLPDGMTTDAQRAAVDRALGRRLCDLPCAGRWPGAGPHRAADGARHQCRLRRTGPAHAVHQHGGHRAQCGRTAGAADGGRVVRGGDRRHRTCRTPVRGLMMAVPRHRTRHPIA
jgi:sugar lactone lactonase YvrE